MPRNRLTLDEIEPKKKKFVLSKSYRDTFKQAAALQALAEIKEYVENGRPLPARYYRRDSQTTVDQMLQSEGFLHLHAGDPSTRVLIYAIQYDDAVLILEITGHEHFQTKPPGTVLHTLHDKAVGEFEKDLDVEVAAKNAEIRARLFGKKPANPDPKA